MRITSKGQVTIPQEIREQFGLLPDTEVDFVATKSGVRIVKAANRSGRTRGQELVRRLSAGSSVTMSTDEILALTRGKP